MFFPKFRELEKEEEKSDLKISVVKSLIQDNKGNVYKEYTDLCAELNIQLEKENASDETDLSGKIFVITGTLTGYPNRRK